MVKLSKKYRMAAADIVARKWMSRRDKYWALDSLILVCVYDTKSPDQDLQILQRLQFAYLSTRPAQVSKQDII